MSSELPKGWQSVRIGNFARELSERNHSGGSMPVLSMTKHRGFVRAAEYFSKSVHSENTDNYKVVRKGQFAYATIHLDEGSIDFLRRYDAGLISPMYTVFELTSEAVDSEFIFRSLKRLALIGRFDPYSNGGVNRRKSISFHDLRAFRFALPPLPEQRAITDILDAVEAAIGRAVALIAAVADAKRATMRDLLTRGVRRSNAPLKKLPARWVLGRIAEGVTHIPADWDLAILSQVAKLESGHTPSRDKPGYWGGDIPWISLADTDALDALTIGTTAECVTPDGIAKSSARVLPAGTVVLSRTATVGKASRMVREMATSQDFANWVCGPKLLPAYLVQVFRHMGREWERLQEGSTHQTIYMPVFKKLQILLPSVAEQEKIAAVGEAFDMRIENEQAELAALKNCRNTLAQELLSGRLRLPECMIARHANTPDKAA
ncbi:restriction endonuclease subunit S [Mesorhizobium sp. LMG 17147]|uniref:restriction endonuclease subunit S n=1 Tax=Mesorhizobium sp. LMG 17147 TaxID=2963091 RepID=UPI0020C9CCE9|nr:restriction endonuclease subunit S [Mesorhizobium sp. LMG 17147]MCP9231047.1 restriction endonuclease subunit S [Mesorhizobium sp. LMG 17147]